MSDRNGSPANGGEAAGLFVTFEGIEGCGKTTQLERLADRLRAAGRNPLVTREPGGTELGRRLRALLLARDAPAIGSLAELLLYTTDRAQHLEERVLPALRAGRVVLCDRYLDATLAYQGHGRALGVERILRLHRDPPLDLRPRRTILLDLQPEVALERARARNRDRDLEVAEGRFEQERLAFHERVRAGYLKLAESEPDRVRLVAADGNTAEVESRVAGALTDLLPELRSA
jgi:dTMP kinase